jgi:geranylgeranyl diphosphate synthase type II
MMVVRSPVGRTRASTKATTTNLIASGTPRSSFERRASRKRRPVIAQQTSTPALVPELLAEYGGLAREALLRFLPDREPRRYLYDLVVDYPRRGGRLMRSTLCIASARAHGAPIEQAMHCAVSVELLHNALLVVDDIQDDSEERRGQPSLHQLHGIPIALNVGSTMTVLSLVPLLESVTSCGPLVALRIFNEAVRAAQACAEGQAMELGWRRDNNLDVNEHDYLRMVTRKTCSYSTIYPIHAGALIGTRRTEIDASLLRYAHFLGLAFQIQDDLLNVDGDHAQYGKEMAGDLYEGKRTLLTIALLQRCDDAQREWIGAFLAKARADKSPQDVARILGWLRDYDCIPHARHVAQNLLGAAQYELEQYATQLRPSRDKDFLLGVIRWVIEQI